jgi:hypothetical protein
MLFTFSEEEISALMGTMALNTQQSGLVLLQKLSLQNENSLIIINSEIL